MKKWQAWMAVAAIGTLSAVVPARAASRTADDMDPRDFYQAQEMSVDLFGSASLSRLVVENPSGDRVDKNARLGAGAGLNYFFTRNFGIGADAYTENTEHAFVDSLAGNLIVRFPIGQSGFAPYVFGGAGRQWDLVEQYFGNFGAGTEFRFKRGFGVFIDARYAIAEKTSDYVVGRLGVRLSF